MAVQLIQPSLARYVREVAVPVSLVEGDMIGAYQKNIQVAIVVVIQEGAPIADGLKDVHGTAAGNRPLIAQSGGFRHIHKSDIRRGCGRGRVRSGMGCAPGSAAARYGQQAAGKKSINAEKSRNTDQDNFFPFSLRRRRGVQRNFTEAATISLKKPMFGIRPDAFNWLVNCCSSLRTDVSEGASPR